MNRIASFLLLTIMATATSSGVWAADPIERTIGFETRRGHLIVAEAQVEGHSVRALIDTGANRSVVDSRIAKRLGLRQVASNEMAAYGKTSKVERVIIRSLQVGPIHTAALALVSDLSDWRVDAIIGMDVLSRQDFRIDFAAEEIVFGEMEALSESVQFDLEHSLVIVLLEVRGHKLRLSVDTGASRITLHQTDDLKKVVRSPLRRPVRSSYIAGTAKLTEVRLRDVRLGSTHWNELRANVTSAPPLPGVDKQGVLSIATLGLTKVQFDFDNGLFSWER